MEARKTIFIINPAAGNWLNVQQTHQLIEQIQGFFGRVEIVFSEAEGENSISNLAREAQKNGFDTIIGRGGDGTLNNIVNGIDINDSSMRVGIIPAGTGNDVASTLHIPWKTKEALSVIKQGYTRQIDLGIVNGVRFANTVSIGLDALINQEAIPLKPLFQRLGLSFLAYVVAIVPIMFRKRKDIEVSFETDSENIKRNIGFATVTNCYRYGKGFIINPEAKLDDGWLDLCICNHVSPLALPYYALRENKGTHISLKEFSFHRFKKLEMKSSSSVCIQIDGEVHAPLDRCQVSILPRALTMIVPSYGI